MIYLWASLLVVWNAVAVFLTLLSLPGTWLMVLATVLLAWWQWDIRMFSPWTLGIVVALAVAGEVLEFLASAVGVRKAGGTRRGSLGALLGSIVGAIIGTLAIPIPVIGSLVGTCGGAFAGAWLLEITSGRTAAESVRSGLGGGAGRVMGTLAKFVIAVILWVIIAVAAFWP